MTKTILTLMSLQTANQPAFSLTTTSEAIEGSCYITISTVAKEQRTNLTPNGGSVFSSTSQILNSGNSFSLAITIGSSNQITHNVTVATATPQGIVDAVNAASLDVTAQLIDKGSSGTDYIIQLTGKSGL